MCDRRCQEVTQEDVCSEPHLSAAGAPHLESSTCEILCVLAGAWRSSEPESCAAIWDAFIEDSAGRHQPAGSPPNLKGKTSQGPENLAIQKL